MMNRRFFIVGFILLTAAACVILPSAVRYLFAPQVQARARRRPLHVVATVKTVPLAVRVVRQNLQTYGTVVARTSSLRNVAVPFESQCLRVLVSSGQRVKSGQRLLRVQASPSSMLALAEARNRAASAEAQYQQTLASLQLHLVTRSQLLAAVQARQLANLQLRNLVAEGVGGPRYLTASHAGVINFIYARPGEIIPPGSPLLQVVSSDAIEIRMGVESADISLLHRGMPVNIFPIGDKHPESIAGNISLTTLRVNPATRLVDVFITPQNSSGLLLGEYVRVSITVARRRGLVVPRAAVLPDGPFENLYTVVHGVAHLHHVRILLKKSHEYLIAAPHLAAGDEVVIQGNPQLKNLMDVTNKFRP
jgi:membrane fusion protein (multidrug efflux system)